MYSFYSDDIEQRLYKNVKDIKTLENAMFRAIKNNKVEAVKFLLSKGVDVNLTNSYHRHSLLYIATEKGNIEIVDALISAGADVNLSCYYFNETPLYTASENGHTRIVEMLLNNGANPNINSDYTSVLLIATKNKYTKIVHLLLKAGANVNFYGIDKQTSLWHATKKGYTNIVELLLHYGADVNLCDKWNQSPLYNSLSLFGFKENIVRLLLKYGANPSICKNNNNGPLYLAIYCGHENIIEPLLEHGNLNLINLRDEYNRTVFNIISQNFCEYKNMPLESDKYSKIIKILHKYTIKTLTNVLNEDILSIIFNFL